MIPSASFIPPFNLSILKARTFAPALALLSLAFPPLSSAVDTSVFSLLVALSEDSFNLLVSLACAPKVLAKALLILSDLADSSACF